MDINEKLNKLRTEMKKKNLDCYIVPTSDPHKSEYLSEHWKVREWLTGFTGSAGVFAITQKKAVLWVDGRYHIQAEEELKNTDIEVLKQGYRNVESMPEWVLSNVESNGRLGLDGKLFTIFEFEIMEIALNGISIETELDIITNIWENRPPLPKNKVFIYEEVFSGESTASKVRRVQAVLKENEAKNYIISSLEDIMWAFNIRGNDIEYNPYAICYGIITEKESYLYINREKLDRIVEEKLIENNIIVKDYCEISENLGKLEGSIYLDSKKISIWLYNKISENTDVIRREDIIERFKAIKNPIQIEKFRGCQIKDGLAMVRFLIWLESNIKNGITEYDIKVKLKKFREKGEHFIEESFETIAGYKENGAIVHYNSKKDSSLKLKDEGLLLIDSGGQYLDGTTDITRTVSLGAIYEEEKRNYTLVLKGHINLAKAIFPYGTTGSKLDILARKFLWEDKLDFKHGTGHGVGYFSGVHEGPQNISPIRNNIELEGGMFITNEPGYYKEDKYGIRIENILLIKNIEKSDFMEFETITYCPIDLTPIKIELLESIEINWINNYHRKVYEKLSPYLDEDEKNWLKDKVKKI